MARVSTSTSPTHNTSERTAEKRQVTVRSIHSDTCIRGVAACMRKCDLDVI